MDGEWVLKTLQGCTQAGETSCCGAMSEPGWLWGIALHGGEGLAAGTRHLWLPEVFTMCRAKLLGDGPWHLSGGKHTLTGLSAPLAGALAFPRVLMG